MWFWKVCLMQVTTYSVSDSVSWIGLLDDLNSGPNAAISGTEESCSAAERKKDTNIISISKSKVLMDAPTNTRIRKNLEAALIALKRPSLNDQLDSNQLILFQHDVT